VRSDTGEPRRSVEILVVWEQRLHRNAVGIELEESLRRIAQHLADALLESSPGSVSLAKRGLEYRLGPLWGPPVLMASQKFFKGRLVPAFEVGTVFLGRNSYVTVGGRNKYRLIRRSESRFLNH
jgi:hypothetical protein